MKLTLDQRAVRRLERLRKHRLRSMPLFVVTGIADEIEPLPTVPQIKQWYAKLERDVRRRVLLIQYRALGKAAHYQRLVAALVSPAELHHLCARRHIYPPTPDYAADFWRRTYAILTTLATAPPAGEQKEA